MRVSFYSGLNNFGDILNYHILQDIFKIEDVKPTAPIDQVDLFFIGSRLQHLLYDPTKLSCTDQIKAKKNYVFSKKVMIMGTGFIQEATGKELLKRKAKVIGLRGELSKKRFEKITRSNLKNLILGDPGLLCSLLLTKPVTKKYSIGIIPHYVDKENTMLQELQSRNPNSILIDVQKPPMEVLSSIASCETIISSAMHGLIAADSLGVPNIRMVLSDDIIGGDYKFNDYYSVYKINSHPKMIINSQGQLGNLNEKIQENYTIERAEITKVQENLLNYSDFLKSF